MKSVEPETSPEEVVVNLILAVQEWQSGNDYLFSVSFDRKGLENPEIHFKWLSDIRIRKNLLLEISEKFILEEKRGRFCNRSIGGSDSFYPNTEFEIVSSDCLKNKCQALVCFHRENYDEFHKFFLKVKFGGWFVERRQVKDISGDFLTEYYI